VHAPLQKTGGAHFTASAAGRRKPHWHYALTKAQSQSLEAVQKRAIDITHNLTRGMPYSSMLLSVNLDSLAAGREDLSRRFFRDIMDPAGCLHIILPSSTQIRCYHL